MSIGRPRVDYLRREQRRCHVHGICEWTRYESINAAGIIRYNWQCMRCANDASKAVYRFQQLHPETIKNGTCFCE